MADGSKKVGRGRDRRGEGEEGDGSLGHWFDFRDG